MKKIFGILVALVLTVSLALPAIAFGPVNPPLTPYDVLIKNGTIVDGTGAPAFRGHVFIKDGKIAKVVEQSADAKKTKSATKIADLAMQAKKVIDASGLVVAPGFIDNHAHGSAFGRCESKIYQGVTTEIRGPCGGGLGLRAYNPKRDYVSLSGYFNCMEEQGVSLNVGAWVGQSTIRGLVIGSRVDRAPTEEEMERMKRLVAAGMEGGAFGLSTGLIYPPSSYADTDELVELVKVIARYGGVYKSHIRGEGDELLEAVAEAIEIGERAGVPVSICHFKCAGSSAWKAGLMVKAIELIEAARARGVEVTTEQYPYLAGSTGSGALIPTWAREGGTEEMLERFRDPEIRAILKQQIYQEIPCPGWWNLIAAADGWGRIVFTSNPYVGKTFVEIAQIRGVDDPADALFDMYLDGISGGIIIYLMCDEDVELAMQQPWNAVGSDGSAVTLRIGGTGHPRSFGTWPRVLGVYVREKGVLTLEDAVRKMTWLPAQQIGITDRGKIAVGMAADITIFDPETVIDKATYIVPHQFPEGIPYVIVNGVVVIYDGEHTNAMPGIPIRLTEMNGH